MVHYEKEQIEAARNIDLVAFLRTEYPTEIVWNKEKKRWERNNDGSIEIFTNEKRGKSLRNYPSLNWYDYSSSSGGDSIAFLNKFLNIAFGDAVKQLLEFEGKGSKETPPITKPKKETTEGITNLPEKAEEKTEDIIKYLTEKRKLNIALIQECIQKKILYSDSKSNCVFINTELQNYYIIRGTNDDQYKFRRSSPGHGYWEYRTSETVEKVYVCESPIDALSLCQLMAKPKKCSFIAMGGLKPETFKNIVENYSAKENIQILCCVDWDEAGVKFYRQMKVYKRIKPKKPYLTCTKDWNEMLNQLTKKDPLL